MGSKMVGRTTYVILIALAQHNELLIVLVQTVISAVALVCLHAITLRLFGNTAANIAGALFVLDIDLWIWNFYILTDSLFISAGIILVYLACRTLENWRGFLFLFLPASFLVFHLRPNGALLTGVVCLYLLIGAIRLLPKRSIRIILMVCMIPVILLGARSVFRTVDLAIRDRGIVRHLVQGTIVWGDDESSIPSGENPDEYSKGIGGLLQFFSEHPIHSLKVFGLRVVALLDHTRRFYSTRHNVLVRLGLYPAYFFALIALIFHFPTTKKNGLGYLLAGLIFLHAITATLSHADWDGRFLQYLIPFVFVFAAHGIQRSWEWLRNRTSSQEPITS